MKNEDVFDTEFVELAWIIQDNGELINGQRVFEEWVFKSYAVIYIHEDLTIENILTGEKLIDGKCSFLDDDEYLKIDDQKNMLLGDYKKSTITRDQVKEFVNNSEYYFRGYEKPKVKKITK